MTALLTLSPSSPQQQNQEILGFIAVLCLEEKHQERLQELSPRTMRWNKEVCLIDMNACSEFWISSAKQQNCEVFALITKHLAALIAAKDFYAACAATPWESLLLLEASREKGFQGIVNRSGRLGRNLFQGITWDSWWEACFEFSHHRAIDRSSVSRAKGAMTLAMQRLGCQRPDQLRTLPGSHIQRRFGRLVSEVWQMTFPERQGLSREEAVRLFPWTSFATGIQPSVKRHLDTELKQWDAIEELLQEDLNRLCVLGSFKKEERILNLEWRIVLCNLQEIPIFIPFRHPHSLHQDCPSQRTALLQILYAFEKNFPAKASSPETGLISWQLIISEKAPARFRQASLFRESSDDLQCLRQLENMIKKPLESFSLSGDWLPEDSFHRQAAKDLPQARDEEDYAPLAQDRPLFLYVDPQRFSCGPQTNIGSFQERTMDKWWKANNGSRDYYRMNHRDTMLWVYRDQQGDWHAQGVYG